MGRLRTSFPWILAALPLLFVAYLFIHIAQAVSHFGHIPKYLTDPDQFSLKWDFFFPEFSLVAYFISHILIILWAACIFLPGIRYVGRHRLPWYLLVFSSAALHFVFIFRDVTGFIVWYID